MATPKPTSLSRTSSKSPERTRLIEENLPLVSSVVNQLNALWQDSYMERADAFGYGVEGLIQAVDRYDPARGVTFSSFAVRRIRGSIIDAVRGLDPLSRPMRKKVHLLQEARVELAHLYGRWPSLAELALRSGVSTEQARYLLQASGLLTRSLESLAHPVTERDQSWDIEDNNEASKPEMRAEAEAEMGIVSSSIHSLSHRDQAFLQLRYVEGLTLDEIARRMKITESGASQFNKRLIARLRRRIQGMEAA